MKTKSKSRIIFAYLNAMSQACIFGVALKYLSGKGFATIWFIIGVTLYILSKFTEKLIETILTEVEEAEER